MKLQEARIMLEVPDGADESEVKKSFKRLAVKYHPDKNKEAGAEGMFKKVNEAYQILTGKQRAEDDYQTIGQNNQTNQNIDLNEMFNSMFNNFKKPSIPDLIVNLKLSFNESVFGVNKSFSYLVDVLCLDCDGVGAKKTKHCKDCKGSGMLSKKEKMGNSFFRTFNYQCLKCQGRGFVGEKCDKCKGIGSVKKKKDVSLNIPPLGDVNQQFLIQGQGHEVVNTKGNVIIIALAQTKGNKEFDGFSITNRNIVSTVEVPLDKLLFGGKVNVKTVHGIKEIDVKKMTRPGERVIISNCGVAAASKFQFNKANSFISGNHIAVIQLEYPKKEKLTEGLKNTLKEIYK